MVNAWKTRIDPTFNQVTGGSVQPASGASISASATGVARRQTTATGSGPQAAPVKGDPGMMYPAGNFVVGMVVFVILVAILMFVAHRFGGNDDDFSNIRASAYNVLIIGLIASIGIPVIKIGAVKMAEVGVPGADHMATWVLTA